MHQIGNVDDAHTILMWVRDYKGECKYSLPRCVETEEAPPGWSFIGHGSFRSVWRSPDGVAYKVNHSDEWDSQSGPEIQHLEDAWDRKDAPEGCRLPKFSGFFFDAEVVVAIELIIGPILEEYEARSVAEHDDLYQRMHDCADFYGLGDMHNQNVIVESSTGTLVPVDFGM